MLTALGEEDPPFVRELAALVTQARQAPGVGGLVTQVYGHAQVGTLVTIGQAGDLHLHLAAAPVPTVLDRLAATRPGPLVANLPPRNLVFTGRLDLLDRLHATWQPGRAAVVVQVQAQALHGLGGVGKTQVALEYAHRHASDYDLIWWVTAEQPAAIPGQLVALARRLGIPEQAEQGETVQALWDALRQRDRWLLVFDDADEPADLRPWWPPANGHLLISSRTPLWAGLAATIAVDVPSRAEAVAFLRHRLGTDDPAFSRLAQALGDLPLALAQAAAYLEQTGTPAAAYLAAYQRLLAKGQAVGYQRQVATTWQLSIDRIAPAGVELLGLCAFLAPETIPLDLITARPEVLPTTLAAAVAEDGEVGVREAAGACYRYSLVDRDEPGIRMHELVQQVVRARLAEPDRQGCITGVVELLAAAFPSSSHELRDPKRWPRCAQLLPHLLAATGHAQEAGVARATSAGLLRRAGGYLERRGEYAAARGVSERALALTEAAYGPRPPRGSLRPRRLGLPAPRPGRIRRRPDRP